MLSILWLRLRCLNCMMSWWAGNHPWTTVSPFWLFGCPIIPHWLYEPLLLVTSLRLLLLWLPTCVYYGRILTLNYLLFLVLIIPNSLGHSPSFDGENWGSRYLYSITCSSGWPMLTISRLSAPSLRYRAGRLLTRRRQVGDGHDSKSWVIHGFIAKFMVSHSRSQ